MVGSGYQMAKYAVEEEPEEMLDELKPGVQLLKGQYT